MKVNKRLNFNAFGKEFLLNSLKTKLDYLSSIEEKKDIIKNYGIEGENNSLYIDYDKIVERVFEYMKNDENINITSICNINFP